MDFTHRWLLKLHIPRAQSFKLFQNSVTERPESFAELCCHGEAPAFPSNALRRVCPINTLMTRLEWLRGDS